ncbi:hypothetical protein BOTBODRAFT_111558 [Botryobasidium botryosum FD-172 SS1]|uniref:CCHC-type domain-containing protein n=1 Tax=Botryobasidium botryosum (strain FD-172 SS1) TaxID=930990 RepID=A0A067MNA5_BOTB1|nr:hypothetical protein BOTBODRAFT_111558 [Botryobasidium botryosum FD-172 SS1]
MLWRGLEEASAANYDAFKEAVYELYPGAKAEQEYTLQVLERLINEQVGREISSRGDLGEYHRAFLRISNQLVKNKQISKSEQDRYFIRGFKDGFLAVVKARLAIKHPDHRLREAYPMKQVYDATMYALDDTPAEVQRTTDGETSPAVPSTSTHLSSAVAPIIRESSQVQDLDATLRKMNEMLTSVMHAVSTGAISATYPIPSNSIPRPPAIASLPRANTCVFCADPSHYVRDCTRAAEYIRAGKCVRGADGKIVLPNSDMVPRGMGGQSMLERIDAWHAANPGQTRPPPSTTTRDPPPHMRAGVNLVEVEAEVLQFEISRVEPEVARIEEVEEEEEDDRVAVLIKELEKEVRKKEGKKSVRFGQARTFGPSPVSSASVGTSTPPSTPAVAPALPRVTPEPTSTHTPLARQYQYHTPIDDPKSQERVCKSRIVGVASLPLRCIEGVVAEKVRCECVLDQGAMIVVMRKDVWERSGVPMRQDMVLTMENANNSTNETIGFLPEVQFGFGGIPIWLKVQVVDNAPFEILLGRPFFSLTSCVTNDYISGEQRITLTDPESGKALTFATAEKAKRRREEASGEDF